MKHYDRYLLAIIGLASVVTCVLVTMGASSGRESAVLPSAVGDGTPFAPDKGVETLKADIAAAASKPVWEESKNGASPFVSRVYLLKDGSLVDILESGSELFAGIPNSWVMEYGLDYMDGALPERDPDDDGFSNTEEFLAKTNPRDAGSKPALWTKLRLSDVKIEKLRFTFKSLPTGSLDKVAINTIAEGDPSALSGATQFYPRSGKKVRTPQGEREVDERILLLAERAPDGSQVFQPTPFRFESVEMTKRFNPATNVEEELPVAVILNTADEKIVRLELNEVKDSPYPLATFSDTRQGETRQMNLGDVLDLGADESYKLVDVSVEGAKIENLATKEQHTVPRASSAPDTPATPQTEQTQ